MNSVLDQRHTRGDGVVRDGLWVQGLTTRYGPVTALDDVDLTAPGGRITAVLGANGAGKTTLLRTVSGLLRPQAGRIGLGGTDLTGVNAEDADPAHDRRRVHPVPVTATAQKPGRAFAVRR